MPLPSLSLSPAQPGAHATCPVRQRGAAEGIPGAKETPAPSGRAFALSAEGNRDLPGAPFSALITGKPGRRGLVGWSVLSVGGALALGPGGFGFRPFRGARRRESFLPDEASGGRKGDPLSFEKQIILPARQGRFFGCWQTEGFFHSAAASLVFPLLGLGEVVCEGGRTSRDIFSFSLEGARLMSLLIGGWACGDRICSRGWRREVKRGQDAFVWSFSPGLKGLVTV